VTEKNTKLDAMYYKQSSSQYSILMETKCSTCLDSDMDNSSIFSAHTPRSITCKHSPEGTYPQTENRQKMRHPAAPTIIAILLGFLAFMVLWARWRGDGHHEGNPHPQDVPLKINVHPSSEQSRSRSSSQEVENEDGERFGDDSSARED
jgi:hypothetical protein